MWMSVILEVSLRRYPIPSSTDLRLAWVPGLGVKIDYAAIVEILIQQLDDQPERMYLLLLRSAVALRLLIQTMKFNSLLRYDGCRNF